MPPFTMKGRMEQIELPVTIVGEETIITGYIARPHQWKLHQELKRFNVLLAHRRFGKTVWAINHLIDRALRCDRVMPRFAYIAPTYGQAKRVAWDYLKQYTSKIPGVAYNEADLRVDIPRNSARITLLSAENPMTLKGMYLDGVVLDEFGEMNPAAWREVIRPTLTDRKGWATFIGTVKGQNHFWEMHLYAKQSGDEEWFTRMFKASETGIVDQKELDSAKRQMTEEEYNQEFECDPLAGLVGAYFGKEMAKAEKEGRIARFAHEPMLPVDTYWDLGMNDMTSIWFCQTLRGRHRMIDYFEVCGSSIPEILAEVRKKSYNHGTWVFPHDVAVRDFSTGRARLQVFQGLGCRPNRVVPRVGTKMDSVNAARMIFGACEFDVVKCEKGLKALANYQRKWNAKNNVFEESPLHNWASNGADAFQQFALGQRGDSRDFNKPERASFEETHAETEYSPLARTDDSGRLPPVRRGWDYGG
jgi:phage terminase large subunit